MIISAAEIQQPTELCVLMCWKFIHISTSIRAFYRRAKYLLGAVLLELNYVKIRQSLFETDCLIRWTQDWCHPWRWTQAPGWWLNPYHYLEGYDRHTANVSPSKCIYLDQYSRHSGWSDTPKRINRSHWDCGKEFQKVRPRVSSTSVTWCKQ